MVKYFRPKHITKRALDKADDVEFDDADLSADAPAPRVRTCNRCVVSIADGAYCEKPEKHRCEKCVEGNRPRCTEVCNGLSSNSNSM
jgi:hypothetical protein